jgi:O-antigen/teichoic acid export membrane protein
VEEPLTPAAAGAPDILDTPAAGAAAIRGGILRIGGYAAGVALSVLAAALLIRHLGPADFGRYTAVISLVTILASIAEGGMTNIGVREYSVLPPGRREQFLAQLTGLRLVTTTAGVVIAVAFAAVAGYDQAEIVGCAIAGVGLMLLSVQLSYAIPLQSQLRLGWVTVLELVRQVATVGAIVLLVWSGAGLVPFFWVIVVAVGIAGAATIPLVRGLAPLLPSLRVRDWRRLLALTVPFGAANAVGAVYVYLAIVVLSLISTEQQTGFFGASFRVFIVLGTVPGLLVASAFPILARAARDDDTRLAYSLQRLWEMHLLLGVGLALCTVVGAGVAIDVVAGAEFEPSVDVLKIQALALPASFLLAVWGFALLSLSFYRGILVANGAALLVSLVLTVAFGRNYGAEGAALATVFGETTLAAAYAFTLFRRRPDLRFELGVVPRVAAALGAAGAVLLVPGLSREVRLVGVAVIYATAAWILRAIPPEVGEALRPRRGE